MNNIYIYINYPKSHLQYFKTPVTKPYWSMKGRMKGVTEL